MEHILKSTGYQLYDASVVKADGCQLLDSNGKRYIDFEAGVWSTALGHNHPAVNAAIKKQLDQITHLGYFYRNPVVEKAAVQVLDTVRIDSGKCIFLSSGSEAVEFGVQAMRRITKKPQLLALAGSYLAAFGSAGKRSAEDWYFLDWSCCKQCNLSECSQSCDVLKVLPPGQLGGLVLEPGNASGLVKLPPKKLIECLEALIRKQGGLVMANEVTTGFGRTGTWFGYEHYGLQPDIVSMGKSIGNGYPVSAVAMKHNIADALETEGLRYAQSHQNDALGCAVAAAVIRTMKEEQLIERGRMIGEKFLNKLEQLKSHHGCIQEVRGRGLMLAMELKADSPLTVSAIHEALFREGFIIGCNAAGRVLRFYPPLIIGEEEIDNLIAALEDIMVAVNQ